MEIKPGYKTSEFYTMVATIVQMLTVFGIVPQGDAEPLIELGVIVVSGAVAVVGLYTYMVGRFKLKEEAVRNVSNASVVAVEHTQLSGSIG